MKSTKFWVVLTAILLAVGLGGMALTRLLAPEGTEAEIALDGEVIRTVDLSQVTETEVFTVESENGVNVVEIAPGRIRVQSADCPDQICVNRGWAEHGGDPIVCLPHRLVITLTDSDGDDPDLVAR